MIKSNKILWFDVETTGLDPKENDIIQLSGMIEIDNEIKDTFNFKMQPYNWNSISDEALKINNTTIEDLKSYEDPNIQYKKFRSILDKYVSKFDKLDKFIAAGYNVRFDIDFLKEYFIKNNNSYLFSYIGGYSLDVYQIVIALYHLNLKREYPVKNFKLETLAQDEGIEIKAHDALSDVEATRELYLIYKRNYLRGLK